jgi:hypothetical protein
MFSWCLRNGLLDRGEELVRRCESSASSAALASALRMQWRLARQKLDSTAAELSPPSKVPALSGEREPPGEREVAAALESLPENAERFFTRELQSKLIAGCAAANCHDARSDGLAFWHDGNLHSGGRGFTRRNLYQILRFIDRENPASSRLLEQARTPHGTPRSTALERSQPAYQLLEYWVYAISKDPSRYHADVLAAQASAAESAASDTGGAAGSATAPPLADAETVVPAGFVDSPPVPIPPSALISSPAEPGSKSIPCDPAIFNEKYHAARTKN